MVLLVIYSKSATENIPAHILKQIAEDWVMLLNETELLERDAKRNIGEELLQAIQDINSGHHGASYTAEPNEITATRLKCGLSQTQFAKALHISSRTLQQWEQGRRHPSGAAETLLKIVAKHPEILHEVLM